MKPFKKYIEEARADNRRQSTSEKIFDIPFHLSSVQLPISPSIFNRVFGEHPKVRAFHTTDMDGVKALLKIQGSKKSISTFFVMTANDITRGIGETDGGIVAEVEGSMLAGFAIDIYSSPDKTGRRWVEIKVLKDLFNVSLHADVVDMMASIVDTIGNRYKFTSEFKKHDPVMEWDNFRANIDAHTSRGKILKDTIKLYIDGSEKIYKKHARALKAAFREYAVSDFRDRSQHTSRAHSYDELLVNEFKVVRIHIPESKKMYNDIFVHTSSGMEARPEPNKRMLDFVDSVKGDVNIMWHKASDVQAEYEAINSYTSTHAGLL